jgi:exopolysaccharide biosynthesis protein
MKKKVLIIIGIVFVFCTSSFLFLFYGPITSFKEFWITSAMTTMNHQYLATWLYSDKYIQKVVLDVGEGKIVQVVNTHMFPFQHFNRHFWDD